MMSLKDEFTAFISRQEPIAEEKAIDWASEKEEWLQYLSSLYIIIEEYLKEYTINNQIIITYDDIELTEENIGCYAARVMTLTFGANRVTLTPIGTLLIGTKGRVDMAGPKGIRRLLLADKNSTGIRVVVRAHVLRLGEPAPQPVPEQPRKPDWEWKIVIPNAPPNASYQRLSQDAFFNALMELSNG